MILAPPVLQAPLAQLVLRGLRDPQVILVRQAMWAIQELLDLLALQELQEPQGLSDLRAVLVLQGM